MQEVEPTALAVQSSITLVQEADSLQQGAEHVLRLNCWQKENSCLQVRKYLFEFVSGSQTSLKTFLALNRNAINE